MFDKINEAENITKCQLQLQKRKNEICAPELFDLSLLGVIYEVFRDLENMIACPPNIDTPSERQKFCFIAIRIYSPSTLLFEERMLSGLRSALSLLLKVKSETLISDYCKKVVFFYKQYSNYRKDMDYLYDKIIEKLKEKGII